MKKIILTLAAVAAFAFSASAQNWYAGGGASLGLFGTNTSQKNPGIEGNLSSNGGNFSLALNPEIGYNINEKIAVGAYLGFGFGVPFEKGSTGNFTFSFNPYFRWNFLPIGDKVKLLADAVVSLGTTAPFSDDVKGGFEYGLNIRPGVSYAFNDKITLVGHIGQLGFNGSAFDGFNHIQYGLNATISPSVSCYWSF